MDAFESAAQKFSKDQSKYGSSSRRKHHYQRFVSNPNTTNTTTTKRSIPSQQQQQQQRVVLSVRAKQEADENRKKQELLLINKKRKKQQYEQQVKYYEECEKNIFGIHSLSSYSSSSSLFLKATSIYGDGDKITLPPSVLEYLTNSPTMDMIESSSSSSSSSPWYFRIGIRNPDYTFPASSLLQEKFSSIADDNSSDEEQDDSDDDDDDDNNNNGDEKNQYTAAYMDELNYKYLAYTHGTVIEFTQEEGYVGLPRSICDALLVSSSSSSSEGVSSSKSNNNPPIPVTRTIDPAKKTSMVQDDTTNTIPMEVDEGIITSTATSSTTVIDDNDNDTNKTAGHVAYNGFDIPNVPIEISLIQKLPKGKGCTLIPTMDAIRFGFYNLGDHIKYILEDSIHKTRATISIGDVIHTWHRGKKYDLHVDAIIPSVYKSISCINTDIEIDFKPNPKYSTTESSKATSTTTCSSGSNNTNSISGGYKLGSSSSNNNNNIIDSNNTNTYNGVGTSGGGGGGSSCVQSAATATSSLFSDIILKPEPPIDQTINVVRVQIRSGGSGSQQQQQQQRRFDITINTVEDLYTFATSVLLNQNNNTNHHNNNDNNNNNFQLVTRFPRRVLSIQQQATLTLQQVGIASGQELFMIEYIS